jgi:hypothetical protein
MTEAEWLACSDPQKMLTFLRDSNKLSERKTRLFAVACCRRIWHLLTDEEGGRETVEVAERYADGEADASTMYEANSAAWMVHIGYAFGGIDFSRVGQKEDGWGIRQRVGRAASEAVLAAAWWGPDEDWRLGDGQKVGDLGRAVSTAFFCRAVPGQEAGLSITDDRWHHPALCHLLRDLFGVAFSRPTARPRSLTMFDGPVVQLAQAAYEERKLPSGHLDRDHLAVLADALEEAGADTELVGHLRGPTPHVRGCWVIDLLLLK